MESWITGQPEPLSLKAPVLIPVVELSPNAVADDDTEVFVKSQIASVKNTVNVASK